jgi:hypothetical protein
MKFIKRTTVFISFALITLLAGTHQAHAGFWDWFDRIFGIDDYAAAVGRFHGARNAAAGSNYIGPSLNAPQSAKYKQCKDACLKGCRDDNDRCEEDCDSKCVQDFKEGLSAAIARFRGDLEEMGITESMIPTQFRVGDFSIDLAAQTVKNLEGTKVLRLDQAGNPQLVEVVADKAAIGAFEPENEPGVKALGNPKGGSSPGKNLGENGLQERRARCSVGAYATDMGDEGSSCGDCYCGGSWWGCLTCSQTNGQACVARGGVCLE